MKKTILLVIFAALIVAGCNKSARTCTTAADCPSGVCTSNACQDAPAADLGTLNGPCTSSSSCNNIGLTCTNSICVQISCTNSDGCTSPSKCVSGKCSLPTSCTSDTGCTISGQTCQNGYCAASIAASGCAADTDCTADSSLPYCVSGACAQTKSCTSDTVCTVSGQVCGSNGYCAAPTSSACTQDSDCTANSSLPYCVNSTCAQTKSCTTNADCTVSGQVCGSNGNCAAAASSSCTQDSDCTANSSLPYCVSGACAQTKSCTSDTDCTASGQVCGSNGSCAAAASLSCTQDSDCTAHSSLPYCVSGKCSQSLSCATNADCVSTGQLCVSSSCVSDSVTAKMISASGKIPMTIGGVTINTPADCNVYMAAKPNPGYGVFLCIDLCLQQTKQMTFTYFLNQYLAPYQTGGAEDSPTIVDWTKSVLNIWLTACQVSTL